MGRQGPLPFNVAVTGHRDLHEAYGPVLSARVRGLLTELRDTYPETPLQLLTPLADGADRLAARVALDLGVPIIAVLPLDPEEYKKDFSPASSAEFDVLLAQASGRVVLPPPKGVELRPECYVAVASHIIQHCHVLIALWDGVETNKPGGTSKVVRACLEGPEPKYVRSSRMLDPQETGLVYHVWTPREGMTLPDAGEARWLVPGGGDEKAARKTLAQLAGSTHEFNRRAADISGDAVERRRKYEGYLTGEAAPLTPVLQRVASLFAIADDLAMREQRWSWLGTIAIFIAAALTVLLFEALTEDVGDAAGWFIGLFVVAQALYFWVKSRGFDDKHLDYRSLAEALRVQFNWRVAGIGESVAPHFMRYRLRESEWVRKAILAGDLRDAMADGHQAEAPANGLALAITGWVHDQNNFFRRKEAEDQDKLRTITLVSRAAGLLGFSVAAAFVTMSLGGAFAVDAMENWKRGLVLVIALLASMAAALQGYADKRALEAQTKRYARMRGIFGSAIKRLSAPDPAPGDARDILRELGKEALDENADWVMLHRDRPLDPPKGPGG